MMTRYLRDINKFLRYRTLFQEYTKMRIPDKRYLTNTVFYFLRYWEYLSFEVLGLDPFGKFGTKICEIQVRLWNKKF